MHADEININVSTGDICSDFGTDKTRCTTEHSATIESLFWKQRNRQNLIKPWKKYRTGNFPNSYLREIK
jgi:hypothetical protein